MSRTLFLSLFLVACGGKASDTASGADGEGLPWDDGGSSSSGDGGSSSGDGGGGGGSWGSTEGTTYRTNPAEGDWEQPAGVGSVLAGYLEHDLAFQVQTASDSSVALLIGWASGNSQDACVATSRATDSAASAPDFNADGEGLALPVTDSEMRLDTFRLSGSVVGDGSASIGDISLAATQDLRNSPEFWETAIGITDPDEICEALASFSVACETCDDGKDYCLSILVTGMTASSTSIAMATSSGC